MARKKKEQPSSGSQPVQLASEEVAPVVPPALSTAPTTPPPVSKWRVTRDLNVSLFGHMTYLTRGTVLSASEYGPEGIARLQEQQGLLEPMV